MRVEIETTPLLPAISARSAERDFDTHTAVCDSEERRQCGTAARCNSVETQHCVDKASTGTGIRG